MPPLNSRLFAGDDLLQRIADDVGQVRISRSANSSGPSVGKVQQALLLWRPGILPKHGADAEYGSETANAVHIFKVEELGVPEQEVIDDVGPRTVQRLDEIAKSFEEEEPGEADPIPAGLTAAVRAAAPALLALPGVLGVGAGFRYEGDQLVEEPAVHVFVADEGMAAFGIPSEIAGVSVVVTPAEIDLCAADETRYGEVKGGCQIVHPSTGGGAGTVGAIVQDAATGELLGLTNQHVVGDPGGGGFPEVVYQPKEPTNVRIVGTKPADIDRSDAVGVVTKSEYPRPIPHVAGAIVSDMDAALFKVDELASQGRTASPAILDNEVPGKDLIPAVKSTRDPVTGDPVRKRGAATQLTSGIVLCASFHCCWAPKDKKNHHVVEQALVLALGEKPDSPFCKKGDSGALVLHGNSRTGLGLLHSEMISQGRKFGIAAKIRTVELRLGIKVAWA